MGLFDKIFRRETEGTDIEVAFGLKQISNITREQALEIPAVSAAVNFIAGTIASLPIRLYNSNDEVQTAAEITADNRLYQLNEESGDTLNPTEIKRAVIRDMLLDGTGDANFIAQNDAGTTVNRWLTTGMLCASASSNETGYLTQKFTRALGMLAVDNQARV